MKNSGNGENGSMMTRMILIGAAAAGVGVGGNYALPDPHESALNERITSTKEQMERMRISVSSLEREIADIWKLEIRRDALGLYWIERMKRLEKFHDVNPYQNGRFRAAPGGMYFPDPP